MHYGAFVIEFTNPAGEYGVWVSFSIEEVDSKSGYGYWQLTSVASAACADT